jgi:hypothetical protein
LAACFLLYLFRRTAERYEKTHPPVEVWKHSGHFLSLLT